MPIQTKRKKTRRIYVGDVPIGDGAPVAVQSMTNTDTRDIASTMDQLHRLTAAGCEIVRLAVPDEAAAKAFKEIKRQSQTPLIADIHFDHRLALAALDAGADGFLSKGESPERLLDVLACCNKTITSAIRDPKEARID